jgi:hypothetical protein
MKCLYVSSPLSGQLFNIQYPPADTVDRGTWPPRAPIDYFALSVNMTDRVSRRKIPKQAQTVELFSPANIAERFRPPLFAARHGDKEILPNICGLDFDAYVGVCREGNRRTYFSGSCSRSAPHTSRHRAGCSAPEMKPCRGEGMDPGPRPLRVAALACVTGRAVRTTLRHGRA